MEGTWSPAARRKVLGAVACQATQKHVGRKAEGLEVSPRGSKVENLSLGSGSGACASLRGYRNALSC